MFSSKKISEKRLTVLFKTHFSLFEKPMKVMLYFWRKKLTLGAEYIHTHNNNNQIIFTFPVYAGQSK